MSESRKVAVLVGSLRQESSSRKLAKSLAQLAPSTLSLELVRLDDLPLYNQDLEGELTPTAWLSFRNLIRAADSVLFVTPEYNRSLPAVLKNALDVGSRPFGRSVWNAKPGAVVGASPGALGAFGAIHHLRQILVSLNVPVLQQPEVYLSGSDKLFDNQGNVASEGTRMFLEGFMGAFATWIERNLAAH